MKKSILSVAAVLLASVPAPGFAQSTPHWKLELEPASRGDLPEVYAGCTVSMEGGRVMAISPVDAAERQGLQDTWIWDYGWRRVGTGENTPFCLCASSTFDQRASQPVVVTTNFDTDAVRVSRWDESQWEHRDVPLADLSPRIQPTVLWDEGRQALLVTGGHVSERDVPEGACVGASEQGAWSCYRETWSVDGDDWTLLDDGCGPGPYPGCEPDAAAWDPVSGTPRLVDIQRHNVQLWEFTDQWQLVDESEEFHHGNLDSAASCWDTTNLALDPRNGNWVGFGGIDMVIDGVHGDYFGFWGWSERGGWQPFLHEPKDLDPAGQEGARLGYLDTSDEFLMFGGHKLNESRVGTNETWRIQMRRRGLLGGSGTGCCATTRSQPGPGLFVWVLALIAAIRRR